MPLHQTTAQVTDHVATGGYYASMREELGLPQNIVAKRMGISASYLSDLERGRRNWDEDLAVRADKAMRRVSK